MIFFKVRKFIRCNLLVLANFQKTVNKWNLQQSFSANFFF
jgi:hypothetical protein